MKFSKDALLNLIFLINTWDKIFFENIVELCIMVLSLILI